MSSPNIGQIIADQLKNLGAMFSPEQKTEFAKILMDILGTGSTPMKAVGMDESEMEFIYSYASDLYKGGKYKEARDAFVYLTHMNANDPRYFLGLAASFHKLKDYKNALKYYLIIPNMEEDNPTPWAHAGDCYIQLGMPDLACAMFHKSIEVAAGRPQYEELIKQSTLLLNTLENQLGVIKKEIVKQT